MGDPSVPSGILERGLLLRLRFELDHHVNLRPARLFDGVRSPLAAEGPIDMLCVREGTEGPYVGNGGVLRKARAYIDEKYGDSNLTLHDVAAHVALSNNHFCTVFSQEMGVTFTEYLTGVRMQRARELLADTSMRTADVAYAVGYNDPHYFSYLFKKNTGLSPREYRKDEKIGVSGERK